MAASYNNDANDVTALHVSHTRTVVRVF